MHKYLLTGIIILLTGLILTGSWLVWQKNRQAKGLVEQASTGYGDPLVYEKPQTQSEKPDFSQYDQYREEKRILQGEIKEGEGALAEAGKQVAIYYIGYLTSGQVFDQSKQQPLSFRIGDHRVIPGMEQGVVGMKIGGKRRIIIPPALGYGGQAHGPIPANSVLIFDVELLAVQ